MSDELDDLAAAARGGDKAAFEQLVRATFADTYTLAVRLLGDEEDARDVVQETYIRAYRAIGRFRGDAQVTTWLYRITANCATTHLGRRARHRHAVLHEDAPVVDLSPERDPQLRAEAAGAREQLTEALNGLSPALRAVVVLRDVYDLPHGAIARELGISESAAKVRLHRARKLLRQLLHPVHDEGETARAV